jgi:hypothetical protein
MMPKSVLSRRDFAGNLRIGPMLAARASMRAAAGWRGIAQTCGIGSGYTALKMPPRRFHGMAPEHQAPAGRKEVQTEFHRTSQKKWGLGQDHGGCGRPEMGGACATSRRV